MNARLAAELVSAGVALGGVAGAVLALDAWWIAGVAAVFLVLDLGEQLLRRQVQQLVRRYLLRREHPLDALGSLAALRASQGVEGSRRAQALVALVGGGHQGAGEAPAESRRDGDRILGPCGASSCASVHRCKAAPSRSTGRAAPCSGSQDSL